MTASTTSCGCKIGETDFRLRITRRELLRVKPHVLQSDRINHRHADDAAHERRVADVISAFAFSKLSSSTRHASKNFLPSGVTMNGRLVRSISCAPSSSSSCRTAWLAADCEMRCAAAPKEKLPDRMTSQ